jgi:hypothetical protein
MTLSLTLMAIFTLSVIAHRRATRQEKKPTVWYAIAFSIGGPAVLFFALIVIGDFPAVFTKSYWTGTKASPLDVLPPVIAFNAVFCLIPATVITFLFQRKFRANASGEIESNRR